VAITAFNAVHPINGLFIVYTDAGIVMFSKLVQLRNMFELMYVKFEGRVISSRFVHPLNMPFVVDIGFVSPVKY
jgi:hypothetical protein